MIHPETLKELLDYDAITGKLYWMPRCRRWFENEGRWRAFNREFSGSEAFTSINENGYKVGTILTEKHRAHRVIWCIVHGEWPKEIDHINGIRTDNRVENLRDVSRTGNMMNTELRCDNTSGVVGVSWSKRINRWVAYINSEGKRVPLGTFNNKEDAISSRKAAELEYGYHPNHGRNSG